MIPPLSTNSTYAGFGFGCGDFQLRTENGGVTCIRSMEFPIPMNSQLTVYSASQAQESRAPDGTAGLAWLPKYNFVGITVFGLKGPVEGMNEKGLTFGFLTFDGSGYTTISDTEKGQALALMDVGTWILGNFADVKEVKKAIHGVKIWGEFVEAIGQIPGLHIALHDAAGYNLVIEFINGRTHVHDNPVGVLTNDPSFDWHMKNLAQYNHLTNQPSKSMEINGTSLPTRGLGEGMSGLPGGWSSTDRFTRIATMVRFVGKLGDEKAAISAALHLSNNVDIPNNAVIGKLGDKELSDQRLWLVIKDLVNKIFYFMGNDFSLKCIDLNQINFKAVKHNQIPIETEHLIIFDITDNFKPSK